MLHGSCLCGAVKYTVAGEPLLMENCHCSMCRKAHGGAYTTFLKIARKDFAISAGDGHIVAYRSSPEVTRSFCRECGGKFTFDWT
ncbi:MAG: GFA family protein, partial [Gammaproteobacteria bacterium]